MSRIYIRSVLSAALVAVLGAGLAAQQMAPTPPRGSAGRRAVRPHGHPRHHRHRRHRRAAPRPDRPRRRAEPHHRGRQRRLPAGAHQPAAAAGQGHQGNRRRRPLPDAGLRRCARALRRRPGQSPGLRLQAVADARRHDRARRAVRFDGLGPGAARGVGEEPDRGATHLRVPPSVQRRGLGSQPAADARGRAGVGAVGRQEGYRRPQARRARPGDHGGAARRGEEAQPRLDRASRSDGRGADDGPRCLTARARHGDALLRSLREPAQGLEHPGVSGEPELQRRAASLRPGRAPVGQDSPARQRSLERVDQGVGGPEVHHRSDDDDLLGGPRRDADAQRRLARKVHAFRRCGSSSSRIATRTARTGSTGRPRTRLPGRSSTRCG